jgi:hypothetical protein
MEQKVVILLTAAVFGCFAILFTIIGVATPGWGGRQLLNCGSNCATGSPTGAGILLMIAIVALMIAVIFTLLFARQLFANSELIKGIVLALFVFAAIFIIVAYSSVDHKTYGYRLTVTASILSFLSAIVFTYWLDPTDA